MAKRVIVAEVTVEATSVSDEPRPFISCNTFSKGSLFKSEEVLALEVCLEHKEDTRRFVADLVIDNLSSGPGGLGHPIGVVLLLCAEMGPGLCELQVLNSRV